jgi:hypothetical protein
MELQKRGGKNNRISHQPSATDEAGIPIIFSKSMAKKAAYPSVRVNLDQYSDAASEIIEDVSQMDENNMKTAHLST